MKKIVVASTVLFGITSILSSCTKESMSRSGIGASAVHASQVPASETLAATVSAGNTYILNFGPSSTATIIKQASHYQSSETFESKGDGGLQYKYTPELNYTGSDEVMLNYTSPAAGNCGNSHPAGLGSKYLTIKLNVTN